MIGGDCQTAFYSDVCVLNVEDRTWEMNAESFLPMARTGHTCVTYQGRLYVFGGKRPTPLPTTSGENGENSDGNGGNGGNGDNGNGGKTNLSSGTMDFCSDLLEYNPEKRTWTKIVPVRPPNASSSSSALRGGGGGGGGRLGGGGGAMGASSSASKVVSPLARAAHSCDVIESLGKMFIFGGISPMLAKVVDQFGARKMEFNYLNTVHVFDFATRTWTRPTCTGETPAARAGHASCVIDDQIYIFGGRKHTIVLYDLYVLNTRTFVWRKIRLRDQIHGRVGHSMCYYPQGGVILSWGGGDCAGRFFDTLLMLRVGSGAGAGGSGSVVSSSQRPFVAGSSSSSSSSAHGGVGGVVGGIGEWISVPMGTPPSEQPTARFWQKMLIRDNTLFMFGGGNKQELYNDLHAIDLTPLAEQYQRMKALLHPSMRVGHGAGRLNGRGGGRGGGGRAPHSKHGGGGGGGGGDPHDDDDDEGDDNIFPYSKIKVYHALKLRVLTIHDRNMNYNKLIQLLRSEYKSNNIVIRYFDGDKELITIRSDDELRAAADFFGSDTPRFEIEIPKDGASGQSFKVKKPITPTKDPSGNIILHKASFPWKVIKVIGQGAYGTVYEVIDKRTGRFMAAKRISFGRIEDPQKKQQAIDEVIKEIELMKGLSHENIVRYIDVEVRKDSLYIFLEYVPKGSLASMLSNCGPLPESTVRNYTRQILQGLQYLHNQNIVHRDIKSANLLVNTDGVIKLADFGHSKVINNEASLSARPNQSVKGTPMWMAPEVVKCNQNGKWSDIWSVGCVVVELMTGECPYPNLKHMDPLQIMIKIAHDDTVVPAIPQNASLECQQFLGRIFQRDPLARPTVEELLEMDFITKEYIVPETLDDNDEDDDDDEDEDDEFDEFDEEEHHHGPGGAVGGEDAAHHDREPLSVNNPLYMSSVAGGHQYYSHDTYLSDSSYGMASQSQSGVVMDNEQQSQAAMSTATMGTVPREDMRLYNHHNNNQEEEEEDDDEYDEEEDDEDEDEEESDEEEEDDDEGSDDEEDDDGEEEENGEYVEDEGENHGGNDGEEDLSSHIQNLSLTGTGGGSSGSGRGRQSSFSSGSLYYRHHAPAMSTRPTGVGPMSQIRSPTITFPQQPVPSSFNRPMMQQMLSRVNAPQRNFNPGPIVQPHSSQRQQPNSGSSTPVGGNRSNTAEDVNSSRK